MSVDPRDFGALEAEVANLKVEVAKQSEKIDQLIALANKGKGAYWAGLTSASVVGTAIGYAISFFKG